MKTETRKVWEKACGEPTMGNFINFFYFIGFGNEIDRINRLLVVAFYRHLNNHLPFEFLLSCGWANHSKVSSILFNAEQYADSLISYSQFMKMDIPVCDVFIESLILPIPHRACAKMCENTIIHIGGAITSKIQLDWIMYSFFSIVLDSLGIDYEFDPSCRTDTAISLANSMYAKGNFSAMPILADALEDADCKDQSLLADLRNPTKIWYKGNWIVDKLLGKR